MAVVYKRSVPELVHVTARALIIEIQLDRAPVQITQNQINLIMTLTWSGSEIKTIHWTQVAQRCNFNLRGSSTVHWYRSC